MPLRRLKDIYEKRKSTLKNLLENNKTMDKDRRAELVGAITEIETLVKTIETLREQEIEDNRLLEVRGKGSTVLDSIPVINKFNQNTKNKFEDSGTKHSLNEAFMKKCESSTRYHLYGEIAKSEGYDNVAHIFLETARNELEQAQIILEYMKESTSTIDNLKRAADAERSHHNYYFTRYEKIASDEKYPQIVEFFKDLAQIDVEHEKRFLKLIKNFNENKVFKKDIVVKWRCKSCGYIVEGHEAPSKCKVCKKPRGKFEIHYDVF
ncbi:MAG TPA: rubrerythrin family protein [Alphaproteobacteria bacterium]|nr:rubrerythrin family protein [Alphaproteobacteria bacterium]